MECFHAGMPNPRVHLATVPKQLCAPAHPDLILWVRAWRVTIPSDTAVTAQSHTGCIQFCKLSPTVAESPMGQLLCAASLQLWNMCGKQDKGVLAQGLASNPKNTHKHE